MIESIRFRLTAFNTAIVLLITIAMSVFIYLTVNYNAVSNTDEQLAETAYQLKRFDAISEGKTVSTELSEEYAAFLKKTQRQFICCGIWDYENRTLMYAENSVALPQEVLSSLRASVFTVNPKSEKIIEEADGTYFIHVYRYEDYDCRIATVVFANEYGQMRIAQTVADMNLKNDMVLKVRNAMFISAALSTILSFIGGYFLAGRAVIPIKESIKRQNEFFADASHELRTPITIIRTNLDVVKLSAEESVASQEKWIDNAYGETLRMEKLVSDLLSVSKAELNQDALVKERLDLRELIAAATENFLPLARDKNLNLSFECAPEWSYPIDGDRMKLGQLFNIVIDNAMRYIGEGKNISVTLEKTTAGYVIRVKDDGVGIDEKELNAVFDRFYRADASRSREAGGTGLGLAIARRIVTLHGGVIRAESLKKQGTTIIIELPL